MSEALTRLRDRLWGSLPGERDQLAEHQQKLQGDLSVIASKQAALDEAAADEQGVRDRALIEATLAQNEAALAAVDRELQRLDVARERNRAALRAENLQRLQAIDAERRALLAFVRERGTKLVALERRGRQLWLEAEGADVRGREMRTETARLVDELRALGASDADLSAFDWDFPTTTHALVSAAEGFSAAVEGLRVRDTSFRHGSFLADFFDRVFRRYQAP